MVAAATALTVGSNVFGAEQHGPAKSEARKVPPRLEAMVTTSIDQQIVPAYQLFASITTTLSHKVDAWCENPNAASLAAARTAFADAVHGWARIAHFRFGPARENSRLQRISFLPDPRGIARRQVARAIAMQDTSLLAPGAIAKQSAALQGLPALEQLLYTWRDNEAEAMTAYRCGLAKAISSYVASEAEALERGWTAADGWRDKLLGAGRPGNEVYKSPQEAAAELVRSLLTGLQLVREEMLLPWLKAKEAGKSWAGMPYELSGSSKDYMVTAIVSLKALHKALHLDAVVADLTEKDPKKAWLKTWTRNAYDLLEHDAEVLVLPSAGPGKGKPEADQLQALRRARFHLNGLRQIIGKEIAPAADLLIGFNELDGD